MTITVATDTFLFPATSLALTTQMNNDQLIAISMTEFIKFSIDSTPTRNFSLKEEGKEAVRQKKKNNFLPTNVFFTPLTLQ